MKKSERDKLSKELLFVKKTSHKSPAKNDSDMPQLEETMPDESSKPSSIWLPSRHDRIYSSYSSAITSESRFAISGAKKRIKKIEHQPWPGENTILMKEKHKRSSESR